jgi:proline dehydrogenase
MNDKRDQILSEFHASVQGVDPATDQALSYGRAIKATQVLVREQGQVMGAALDNNRSLWETQKRLKETIRQLTVRCGALEHEKNAAVKATAERDARLIEFMERYSQSEHGTVVELQEEVRRLTAHNDAMRKALTADLMPELDTEKRRAILDDLKRQHAEIKASGLVPTEDEINAGTYTPIAIGEGLPDV